MGNAKRNVRAFPRDAQKLIGDELQLLQFGGMPRDAKPFKGVGSGVFEIAIRYDTDAFRTVLAVQLGQKIYVLHAFQKKSKTGVKTPKQDVEVIRQRYKEARELAKHDHEEKES
jgi:phage-related protein